MSDAIVSWFGEVTGSTTTDSFGNFAAAGLPAGSYTFVASADGCSPGIATVQVVAGKTVRQEYHDQVAGSRRPVAVTGTHA